MKFLILVSIILAPIAAQALLEPDTENYRQLRNYSEEDAFRITTGALLKQREVGILVKTTEAWTWKQVESIGIKASYIRFTATVLAPIIYGKVSTRGLYMHWEPYKDLTIRPDIDYMYQSNTFSSTLNLLWRF